MPCRDRERKSCGQNDGRRARIRGNAPRRRRDRSPLILRHHVEHAARHGDIADALKSEADDGSAQGVDFLPAPEQRTVRHLQTLSGQRLVLRNHVGDSLNVELLHRLVQVAEQGRQHRGNGRNLLQILDPREQGCLWWQPCSYIHLLSCLRAFALDVRRGSRQMDQAKVVRHSVERLGMSQEQISVGQKIVVEVLNHPPFGNQIEINEHVAAENDVEALHESHASVVGKIQTAEGDAAANRRLNLQLFCGRGEIFLAVIRSQIASAVGAVNRVLGVRQGAFVEIGGEDLDGPILETAVELLRASSC